MAFFFFEHFRVKKRKKEFCTISGEPQYRSNYLIYYGTLGYLEKFFKGYASMQICSKLPIEKMFYYKFVCQSTHGQNTNGGQICPPPV